MPELAGTYRYGSGLFSVLLSAWEVWGGSSGAYLRPHQHELVYKIAFLPLLGMLTIFLPDNRHKD